MRKKDTVKRILAASLSAALAVMYVPISVVADDEPVTSSANTDLSENITDLISESEKSEIIETNEKTENEEEIALVEEAKESEEQEEELPCKFIINQSENADIYISEIYENGNTDDNRNIFTDYSTEPGKKFRITVREKNENMKFNSLTIGGESVKTYYNENEEYVCTYALGDSAEGEFEIKADFLPAKYEREVSYNTKTKEVSGSGKDDESITVIGDEFIVRPNEGYYIEKILINDEKFTVPPRDILSGEIPEVILNDCTVSKYHNGDNNYNGAFKLLNIGVETVKIEVEFAKIKRASMKDVEITYDELLGTKNNIYWIKNPIIQDRKSLLTFKAKNPDYKIAVSNGINNEKSDKLENEFVCKNSIPITAVLLYYNDSEYYIQPSAHTIDLSKNPIRTFFVQKGTISLVYDTLAEGCTAYGTDEVKVSLNMVKDKRFEEYGCQEVADKLKINEFSYWFDENESEIKTGTQVDNIIIKSSEYNKAGTVLHVKATDSLGYIYEDSITLDINNTPPEVTAEVSGIQSENAQNGIYNTSRTAKVTITDKDYTFNKDERYIIDSVVITKDGYDLSYDEKKNMISDMQISKNNAVFNINFNDNGAYQWDVRYKNLAGNYNLPYSAEESSKHNFSIFKISNETLNKFKIGIAGNDGASYNWGKIANNRTLEFLNYFQQTVKLIVKVPDGVDVTEIAYYKSDSEKFLTQSELREVEFISSDDGIYVSPNEKVVVYARVTDKAGTVIYLGTDGLIIDKREPQVISIGFAELQDIPENRIFNKDVKFNISVQEETENEVCSGLRDVYYQIYKGDKPIDDSIVYLIKDNRNAGITTYNGEITIGSKYYNYDNMSVKVTAVDNAGNEKTVSSETFSINTYTMNSEFSINGKVINTDNEYNGKSFNSNVLCLSIQCPNNIFSSEKATDAIKNALGNEIQYTIGEWKTNENAFEHTVEITFETDGEYSINNFTYVNEAGNSVSIDGAITFTVDTVAPTGILIATGIQNEDGENVYRYSDLKTGNVEFNRYVNKDNKVFIEAEEINAEENIRIDYYIAKDAETFLDEDALNSLYEEYHEWKLYEKPIEAGDSEGKYVVYLRITDDAGNYTYICSDGFVIDKTEPVISLEAKNKPVSIIEGADVYNEDIALTVDIRDDNISSGIKSAKYYLIYGNEFENYCLSNNYKVGNEYIKEYVCLQSCIELTPVDNVITISAKDYNRSDLKVYAVVEDNSGNINETIKNFDIDITAPIVKIVYDDEINETGREYFNHNREATIYIQERANHFSKDFEVNGQKLDWTQNDGTTIENLISKSQPDELSTPDECVHTARIKFENEGDYNFVVSYTDEAKNEGNKVESHFTIDKSAPTGEVTIESFEKMSNFINSLLENINFGFWSSGGFDIMAKCSDTISPIDKFEYYKSPKSEALTKSELDSITSWTPLDIHHGENGGKTLESHWFTVMRANEQAVVYVKITDMAGNVSYINTNGLIADNAFPSGEIKAPEISVTPQQTASGIYNGNVDVDINVIDPGSVYSGINTITYRVLNNGAETQSGTLYYFYNEAPQHPELMQAWNGQITVDGQLNNSNNVTIEVTAVDNAGNSSTMSTDISIDMTAPVIDMTFSDNKSGSSTENYYSSRTANFVITERNFDSNDVVLNVTKDNVTTPVSLNWQNVGGSGDNTQYSASLPFTDDGNYSFSISFTDMAGNASNQISCEPFIIDSSAPEISVRFDNNEVRESRYFKKKRTAEIVITDNNVNIDTVDIKITGSLDGKSIEIPANPIWVNEGDTYIGNIVFADDGDYTFNIGVMDLSGNRNSSVDYGDSVSPNSFTIDNINPELEVTVNDSAKNGAYSEDVLPIIRYSDLNYDESKVSVSMSGVNVEVTDTKIKDDTIIFTLKNSSGEILEWKGKITEQYTESKHLSGKVITMENFPTGEKFKDFDDIYTLTVSVTDKSGRINADSIVFSVNRFGSTYDISAVKDIIGKYIKTAEDVEIVEINADKLSDIKITVFKNSEAIVLNNGTDYEIVTDGGNGNWHKYRYIIDKKNFKDDGAYRITVHSKDSANNVAENTLDTKNSEISFAVDSTPPLIVVANLENGKTYAEENKSVIFNVNDNLKVDSIEVYLDGEQKPYKMWNSMEVEKFIVDNEEFTFDIGSDSNSSHSVKIVCKDAAGNTTETVISDFYVTTNMMVRYINNKSVFFGSIAGAVAIAGGSAFWIFRKRKRF